MEYRDLQKILCRLLRGKKRINLLSLNINEIITYIQIINTKCNKYSIVSETCLTQYTLLLSQCDAIKYNNMATKYFKNKIIMIGIR